MGDSRKRRGQHPGDEAAFHEKNLSILREASEDLAWLKTRDYADASSLKLVGDRYQLNARQRTAVARSTCSDQSLARRKEREVKSIENKVVYLDGFNLLTTIEAAFGDGVLLIGRDGCLRDMSSMHGNYRVLADTRRALDLIHDYLLTICKAAQLTWYLDQPVSNSGRLKSLIFEQLDDAETRVEVELLPDPDPVLKEKDEIVITADSGILKEESVTWFNAARSIAEHFEIETSITVDFSPK